MRLTLLSKLVVGITLAFVWFPSVLIILLNRVFGLTSGVGLSPFMNGLFTTLILTDGFRVFALAGLVLFVIAHTVATYHQTKTINPLQVVLVFLSALFIIPIIIRTLPDIIAFPLYSLALITLPIYYFMFVLKAPTQEPA